jgi:hypothetical protein
MYIRARSAKKWRILKRDYIADLVRHFRDFKERKEKSLKRRIGRRVISSAHNIDTRIKMARLRNQGVFG